VGRHARAADAPGYRPDVAGLRAVAVTLVVLAHVHVPGVGGGFIGVDVFFVLSGFLIIGLLVTEVQQSGRVSLVRFWSRRARRILPAAMLVLLTTVLTAQLVLTPQPANQVASDARWVAVFGANLHFAQAGTDYFAASTPPSPLLHYWSLAVEEQFYLVIPLVLAFVAWRGRRHLRLLTFALLAATAVASLGWSVIATQQSPTTAYFSTLTRAFELAAGGMLAVALPRLAQANPRRGLASGLGIGGAVAILAAAAAFSESTSFPGTAALLPVAGTVALLAAGALDAGNPVTRLLGVRPMQALGAISYSLYLWHWPLLVLGAQSTGATLTVAQRGLAVAAALVLAAATYQLLENPWRRAAMFVRRPGLSLAAGLSLLLTGFAVPAAIAAESNDASVAEPRAHVVQAFTPAPGPGGAVSPDRAVLSAVALAVGLQRLPAHLTVPLSKVGADRPIAYANGCHARTAASSTRACAFGDPASATTVVMIGDSHMAQWLPALDLIGQRQHLKIVLMSKSGCPVPDIAIFDTLNRRRYDSCARFRGDALRRIATLHPAVVIATDTYGKVLGHPDASAQAQQLWRDGLARSLRALKARSARVVYLRDTPRPALNPLQCLSRNPQRLSVCRTPLATATRPSADFERQIQAIVLAQGASYVDTSPWFCAAGMCPVIIADTSVFVDGDHMTATYSAGLSRVLGRATGLEP
jgi:peptidoglycan/LPS O-acetylase OafA/YrhL